MADGTNALLGGLSYLSVGRESVTGTYNTATAGLEFMSSAFKTVKELKVLEEVNASRTYAQQIRLGKVVTGEVEFNFYPQNTSSAYMLLNALGGTLTSATATGETVSGLAFTHVLSLDSFLSASSLCFNQRKGDSASAFTYQYTGGRIDEFSIVAELDEPIKANATLMFFDSTQVTNDVASAITINTNSALSFVNGRISVETTFASLTSTSFWHVQSINWTINNSIKADSEARRIGTDVVGILPFGMATQTLEVEMRFDTLTAYNAMINNTQFSAELEFLGDTLPTSVIREGLNIEYPRLFVRDAGDPEISGPDEVLTATVVFEILRDNSSATGFAVKANLTNNIASY